MFSTLVSTCIINSMLKPFYFMNFTRYFISDFISVEGSTSITKKKKCYADTCSISGFPESTPSPLPARKLFIKPIYTVIPFQDDIRCSGYPSDSIRKCIGTFFQKVKSVKLISQFRWQVKGFRSTLNLPLLNLARIFFLARFYFFP